MKEKMYFWLTPLTKPMICSSSALGAPDLFSMVTKSQLANYVNKPELVQELDNLCAQELDHLSKDRCVHECNSG